MAAASDVGSRSASSSAVAMTRTLPSAASARRLAAIDEPAGRTSTISAAGTDSAVAVDDQPVDELRDLVDGVGDEAPGDDQPAPALGVLDALAQQLHVVVGQQVGVVDQHVDGWPQGLGRQRTEVAAQAHDVAGGSTARQPRLAVPRRRLEQHDGWDVVRGQPGEQRGAVQAHIESRASLDDQFQGVTVRVAERRASMIGVAIPRRSWRISMDADLDTLATALYARDR